MNRGGAPDSVVSLGNVSKRYRIFPRQRDRIKEALSLGRVRKGRDFWALKDLDLEVERGTTLGILGRNGAGKSTLLRLISGVLQPTRGSIEVRGRIVALLELGSGFNPEFTGRENVLLNGLILGIDRKTMRKRFGEIEEFADIGEFFDQPVKFYSSGMRMRLAFSVAINVEPEILVVDEALTVGDAAFSHMGIQRMQALQRNGVTILFVSHSIGMVKNFCNKAILLDRGRLLARGPTAEVADRYQALLASAEIERASETPSEPVDYEVLDEYNRGSLTFKDNPQLDARRARSLRHGTGEARVRNVELINARGEPIYFVGPHEVVTIRVHLEYLKPVAGSKLAVTLRNAQGLDIFSTDTEVNDASLGKREAGERAVVDFTSKLPMTHGDYSVSTAVSAPGAENAFMDWVDVAATLEVTPPTSGIGIPGLVDFPTQVKVFDESRERSPKKP